MDAPDQHFWAPRLIESIPQRCLVPPGSIRLSSVAAPAPPDCNQEPLQPYRLGFEVWQSAPPALGSFVSQIKSVPSLGFVGSAGSRSELSKGKERTPEAMVQRMISHRPISSSASGAQQSDQDWLVMYQQKTSRNVPTYTYLGRSQIRLAGRRRSSHIVLFDVTYE